MNRIFNKGVSQGKNIFKKVGDVSENIFRKGVQFAKEQAPKILKDISEQSAETADVLGRGAKIANKIGSSSAIQTLPFGPQVAGLAKTIGSGLSAGSKLSGQISNASDLSTYKKGGVSKTIENLADAKRRIEMMRGNEPQFVG